MSNKIRLSVSGKEFTIQTGESNDYMYGLARTLDTRVKSITEHTGASPFVASLIVGLTTLDDYNKTNIKLDELREQAKEYVDEAGKIRLERDAIIAENEQLRSKIAQLEQELSAKKA